MNIAIDVPLPDSIKDAIQTPLCVSLPPPGKAEITLPSGGKLKGVVDITKGIPDDCSLNFSLVLQLAPFLASIDCLLKLLKLVKPLVDVVTGLTKVPPKPPAQALLDLGQAVIDIAPCFLVPTPLIMIPFVRDILLLIIKLLSCVVGQLKSILAVLGGLSLQISSAQSQGNSELLAALQCAQDNANASAQHMLSAIDPVLVLLSLVEPFLGIAGVDPIKTPTIGSAEDIAGLQKVVDTLGELVKVLQLVVDTPPLKQ